MNRRSLLLALAIGFGVVLTPPRAAAEDHRPAMIRVTVEYMEVPHRVLTEWMQGPEAGSDRKLHAQLRALAKVKNQTKDEAVRIVETNVVTAMPGQKAVVESITELIYPTEYDPGDGLGCTTPPPVFAPSPLGRPSPPIAFETRSVGATLEIEPTLGERDGFIDLRFAPELVDYLRLEEWMEHKDEFGDAGTRFPIFESQRVSTSLTLKDGCFALAGTLAPVKKRGGLDIDRKLLLFVKADLAFLEEE